MCIKIYIKSDARKIKVKHPIKLLFQSKGELQLLYENRNTKILNKRNGERCYVPDDLEKINRIIDGAESEDTYINEEDECIDDAQFKTLNKTIHNQKAIDNSTNYKIMTGYLSKLKKTSNSKKLAPEERLDIVKKLLEDDTHFSDLTEKLFGCRSSDRDYLLPQLVEFPLECMASYIQCTQNSNAYLRRRYFDGQIRKRKDGSIYQRKHNVVTEADLIRYGEDGEEISPYKMAQFYYDKYFDGVEDILDVLNEKEKKVALCLHCLSTCKKPSTIDEIMEFTGLTKHQVETLKMKIKCKVLKWLHDNGLYDSYNHYYNLCKNNKNFEEIYEKFIKKCEKTVG